MIFRMVTQARLLRLPAVWVVGKVVPLTMIWSTSWRRRTTQASSTIRSRLEGILKDIRQIYDMINKPNIGQEKEHSTRGSR